MADTEEISNRKPDDEQLAATNGNPDHPGIAAELYISCMALFRDAWTNSTSNQSPKLSQVSRRSLVRIQQNLFLWGETHKVKEGHLDDILRGSSHLMNLVIKLLRSIVSIVFHDIATETADRSQRNAILQLLEQASFAEQAAHDSDSEDSESDSETLESNTGPASLGECIDRLHKYLQCLNDLSATLLSHLSGIHQENTVTKAAPVSEDSEPYQLFSRLIQDSFPLTSKTVAEHFGKANLRRFLVLQSLRLHVDNEDRTAVDVAADPASKPAKSEFQDSGYGSGGQASSYAPSTISSHVSSLSDGAKSKYPALPTGANLGLPFECQACGMLIKARNKHVYRKHLRADLFLYSCPICDDAFENRMDWINHVLAHEDNDYLLDGNCLLCKEALAQGNYASLIHLAKHLEEIALSTIPQAIEDDGDKDDGSVSSTATWGMLSLQPEGDIIDDEAEARLEAATDAPPSGNLDTSTIKPAVPQTAAKTLGDPARVLQDPYEKPKADHNTFLPSIVVSPTAIVPAKVEPARTEPAPKTDPKPFKCPKRGCEFSQRGFESQAELDEHKHQLHYNPSLDPVEYATDIPVEYATDIDVLLGDVKSKARTKPKGRPARISGTKTSPKGSPVLGGLRRTP